MACYWKICVEKHIREGIVIDFGSTTTDFVLIKGGQVINNSFSDYRRLGTGELVYTGIIRTPIFAIMNSININTQKYKIIPEYFSSMSDIYRIHKKIKKNLMLMMKLIRLIKASLVVTIGYQGHLGLILTKNIKD